jgi:hypothetical protein
VTYTEGPIHERNDVIIDPPNPAVPVVGQPVVGQPVVGQPVYGQPVYDQVVEPTAVIEEPLVQHRVVREVPVQQVVVPAAAAPVGQVSRSYAANFAPDSVIAAIVGLVVMVVGLIAMVRGGFDGPMDKPVVSVLGFTHTTTLGVIEAVIGFFLLISGATRSRSAELVFGCILGVAAFVGAVQVESFRRSLALESGMAWLLVIMALAVVLSALLLPRFVRRSSVVAQV